MRYKRGMVTEHGPVPRLHSIDLKPGYVNNKDWTITDANGKRWLVDDNAPMLLGSYSAYQKVGHGQEEAD